MSRWIRIATVDQCPAGAALECVADDRVLALLNVDGELFALDGICPHQAGPLGKGSLTGHTVTCPWHGWQFDVRDGKSQITPSLCQATFPVKVVDGEVFVDLAAG